MAMRIEVLKLDVHPAPFLPSFASLESAQENWLVISESYEVFENHMT
jgi:hypothetical protein